MGQRLLLRWTDDRGAPQERELGLGVVTIGRAADSDIVLENSRVSRLHARLTMTDDGAIIEDLQSRNGTLINDEKISVARLNQGDRLSIAGTEFAIQEEGAATFETLVDVGASTVFLDPGQDEMGELATVVSAAGGVLPQATATVVAAPPAGFVPNGPSTPAPPSDRTVVVPRPAPAAAPAPAVEHGVVPEEWLKSPIISERALAEHGVEVQVVEAATLGGGIGSFQFITTLRNSGMSTSDLAVVGTELKPHARYQRLCINSQIPPHERLRSNSDATPDNIWGFPGYAVREGWREIFRGNLKDAFVIFGKIWGESWLETYTPRTRDVFGGIEIEAKRVGWTEMVRLGRVRAIRKSEEGRIVAIVSASDATRRKHFAVSAKAVHIALGYPAIQLLPDLAEYREKYGDFKKVVNAYEQHDHIYEQLKQRGGTVILRGRGIVASRLMQRLWEDRKVNPNINIIHLNRSRIEKGHRWQKSQRKVVDGWEFQPFNWPKGGWTGTHLKVLRAADQNERKALLEAWGGTTTADRSDWKRIIRQGLEEGWYRPEYGSVEEVGPTPDGKINTRIRSSLQGGGKLDLVADFVIDCTGLISNINRNPVLADLLQTFEIPVNNQGKLPVNNSFEIEQMRHGESRLFASGIASLGGPQPVADSFLGLSYAALEINDSILELKLRGHRKLNGFYSLRQWWKWVRKAAP